MVPQVHDSDSRQPHEHEVGFLDVLVVLFEHARLLVFGPLLAATAAVGLSFLLPPTFTATARILPPQQQQGTMGLLAPQLGALSGLAGIAGVNLKNPADLYVALLTSRTLTDRIIDRFSLLRVYDVALRVDARRELDGLRRVSTGKDGLISIEVSDRDPSRAADIANAHVEELFKLNSDLALTEAQQRRLFFEKELRRAHDDLSSAQLELAKSDVAENLIKSSPEAIVAELARLRALVTAQELRVSAMRGYLTEQSPELRQAQLELANLRKQLDQANRAPGRETHQQTEYLNRYRNFKYQETLFELMAKQYEVARLDEAREGNVIQVVDTAIPPEDKSSPKRALIAVLSGLTSWLLLVLFVLLRDWLRTARHDPVASGKLARCAIGLRRVFRP